MGEKKAIKTSAAPQAIGPYSQAIQMDGWLFLSGQIPLDPQSGQFVSGGISEQTARVLDNLKAVLEAANYSFKDVVKTTVYLSDLNEFKEMNEVYGRYFKESFPARATVQVARLPRDAKVEIEAIARVS